ncbi:MAG: DUF3800 domain-containing protein [Bacteroidota bacterium]
MAREFIIYCDESLSVGPHYSDFYGGALINSSHIDTIRRELQTAKDNLHLHNEVKWTKVTGQYLSKYITLIDVFFDFIADNQVKLRIMFRQSAFEAANLSKQQRDNGYFLLYYQFIKHAFGLRYCNDEQTLTHLRLYFDELPDRKDQCETFKNQIYALQSLAVFQRSRLQIRREDIVDIDSSEHVILQCLDIVLGAMAFRLNDFHKIKPAGSSRRGKRTIAKHKLYKHISTRVRQIYPNFNVGMSTGHPNGTADRWNMPYRHWCFRPSEFTVNEEKFK